MFDWSEDCNGYKLLPRKEVAAVYKKAHKGDKDAVEALYKHTFYWIKKVATKYLGRGLTLDELLSAGVDGLLCGIRSGCFNQEKGAWSTYIGFYIKGKILSRLKKESVVPLPYNLQPKEKYPSCYLESQISEDCQIEVPDNLAWEEAVKASEQIEALKIAILKLSLEEKQIINFYYYHNITFQEIGALIGMHRQRVRQILDGVEQKLKLEMEE